jgi:hypothetical protein
MAQKSVLPILEFTLINSHDADRWWCKLACVELAPPQIVGLACLSGALNPQSVSN